MSQDKDVRYFFSDFELDIIEKHRKLNSGTLTESKYNNYQWFLMESEGVNSSFRVDMESNGQRFVRCCVLAINKEYLLNKCFTPLQLQNNLA
tara:strand:+ start:226 stop:501 length:276 start_codon:yes stop_codon:yes gene_type:complete